jgi:protein-S-isoprenylcysteine O-methyltransferase Ste14
MIEQLIVIGFFALNMLLIWLFRRFGWYRVPGSFIFALLPLATVFFEQPRFELDFFWWEIAGAVAIVLGIGLLVWSKLASSSEGLAVSGPYQFVRHPMYLGLIFIDVGWWWAWAAVYSFYLGLIFLALVWFQAYLEEKLILEKAFGDQYREYRRHAGMFWVK